MHASVRVYTMYINVLALFILFIHAHTHVHTNSPKNQICSSTIAVLVMKILITALLPLKCIENVLLYSNCFRMCLLLVQFSFCSTSIHVYYAILISDLIIIIAIIIICFIISLIFHLNAKRFIFSSVAFAELISQLLCYMTPSSNAYTYLHG